MDNLIQKLGESLKEIISEVQEVYIAVALANDYSIEILKSTPKSCKTQIVVGIDLSTPVEVLRDLRRRYGDNARIYCNEFFHPKVYLFRLKDNSLVGFIGSGNFTKGGLVENTELFYRVTDKTDCNSIMQWFSLMFLLSETIEDSFLNEYKEYYEEWYNFRKNHKKKLKEIIEHQDQLSEYNPSLKNFFIERKKSPEYTEYVKQAKDTIQRVRKSIDYDNDFKNIDIDDFLSIYELGHIIPTYKLSLKESVRNGKLRKLFKMLCDERLSIDERYRRAIQEDKLNGVGKNVITKILVVHEPKKYILWNNKINAFITKFNYKFEIGTKEWEKYSKLCNYFRTLSNEVRIDNFAVLDKIMEKAMDN